MANANSKEFLKGQRHMLVYFIGVASKTEGAEVWRALFSEAYENTARDIAALPDEDKFIDTTNLTSTAPECEPKTDA